jgi:GT2 family glycosyltransferase/SAM-dependent methyltransferase
MTQFQPLEIVHVHLEEGIAPLLERPHLGDRDIYAVFWRAGIPLGHLELTPAQLERPASLSHLIARSIAPAVGDRLFTFGFEGMARNSPGVKQTPELGPLIDLQHPLTRLGAHAAQLKLRGTDPSVSVVVCTRNRSDQLARCLHSLLATTDRPDEVIVVDNEPAASDTRILVESVQDVIYVAESRPGLSRARNAGLREARGDIVAFTDDDTRVHPDWIRRLREGFDRPGVMSVTGLVLPAELDTPAQVAFEKGMGGFSQGYQRIVYDQLFMDRTKRGGTPVWRIGAGANMAIRREAFALVGGFDERLGAGAAGCSEDSEFWYRLLAAGWQCRYEPAAVTFHYHRSDFANLRRQARDYLRGHVAALFVQYSRSGHRGNLRRAFLGLPKSLVSQAIREYVLTGRRTTILPAYVSGYLRGLVFFPVALQREVDLTAGSRKLSRPTQPRRGLKAPLGDFLRKNPYPHPRSEGLFYREKMRAIHTVAPEGPFERVLEIGGGQSGLTADLYPDAEIVNAELDIELARSPLNQRAQTRFVGADATRLPFPASSFDAVTIFDVLEHVPQDDVAASEAIRVLRPGGFLVVTSPNEHWRFPHYRLMRTVCPSDQQVMAEWGHVRRGYSLRELSDLFGLSPLATANYITPMTAVGHDFSFSNLGDKKRRLVCIGLSPLTWLGYWLHRPTGPGTETASSWRRNGGE